RSAVLQSPGIANVGKVGVVEDQQQDRVFEIVGSAHCRLSSIAARMAALVMSSSTAAPSSRPISSNAALFLPVSAGGLLGSEPPISPSPSPSMGSHSNCGWVRSDAGYSFTHTPCSN